MFNTSAPRLSKYAAMIPRFLQMGKIMNADALLDVIAMPQIFRDKKSLGCGISSSLCLFVCVTRLQCFNALT
jgi:hypothetical protein